VVTDALTGLDNRLVFERTLAGEIERCARYGGRGFALLLLDIDHFKIVNDEFGHPAGDAVLKRLAQVLERESRSSDLLARWGGEEFVVLLPGTSLQEAGELAGRLRRGVAAAQLPVPVTLTVSIGVTAYRPGDAPEALLARADRALYAAKRLGRNRVELDPESR
jgi:diguanylate cyclase (GGDEF)-like protein